MPPARILRTRWFPESAMYRAPEAVHGEARGKVELRVDSREAVAAEPGHAGPGDGGDDAAGGHFAHAMAIEFREIEVAGGVHHHIAGGEQLGAGGRSAIAGRALVAVAGHGHDDAVGADAPHAVVARSAT